MLARASEMHICNWNGSNAMEPGSTRVEPGDWKGPPVHCSGAWCVSSKAQSSRKRAWKTSLFLFQYERGELKQSITSAFKANVIWLKWEIQIRIQNKSDNLILRNRIEFSRIRNFLHSQSDLPAVRTSFESSTMSMLQKVWVLHQSNTTIYCINLLWS